MNQNVAGAMTPNVQFVPAGTAKDALLAAEIPRPFSADAVVRWAWLRPPFKTQPRLVAVDARRLPSEEGSAKA